MAPVSEEAGACSPGAQPAGAEALDHREGGSVGELLDLLPCDQVRIAAARVRDGAWTLSPIESIRMATSFAFGDVDADGSLIGG